MTLTCVTCNCALYPRTARATQDGYQHVRCPHKAASITTIEIEDVEWMAETGESLEGAARRLGISSRTLERYLDTQKRRDLRARLVARNPHDPNAPRALTEAIFGSKQKVAA